MNNNNRLSIAECRKILGEKYENFTDEQIEKIREFVYMLVEIFQNNKERQLREIQEGEKHNHIDVLSQLDSNTKTVKKCSKNRKQHTSEPYN